MSLPLHLGWLKDYPTQVPVNLIPGGLKAHTAIIAQSGSGKSFMLGRFLEELLSKTLARVVIFDPNSDFVKLSEIEKGAWKSKHLVAGFGKDDTLEEFSRRWEAIGFEILSDRSSIALEHKKARTSRISLTWADLNARSQAGYLGFSEKDTPEKYLAIGQIREQGEESRRIFGVGLTLEKLEEAVTWLLRAKRTDDPSGDPKLWPRVAFNNQYKQFSRSALARVEGAVKEMRGRELWDRPGIAIERSTERVVGGLLSSGSRHRSACIDLGSLKTTGDKLLVAHVTLNSLWDESKQKWIDAMEKPKEADNRLPCFIVIDEAHNLAPAEPKTGLEADVSEVLVRIASEGRKFGLFLVIVSQRPSRLNPSLLTQCDNLCLMKMNNLSDLELAEKGFGFVPPGYAKKALEFKVGQALLAGSFISAPTYVKITPRRTAEGGRNLQDDHWTKDPTPLGTTPSPAS
ncbi:MAG: ATP-binding protein [Gemmataceae bacterium]